MVDQPLKAIKTLHASKDRLLSLEAMIRKDLSAEHSLESQPIVKRILLEDNIICIDIDASMIVDDLSSHQITDGCKLLVLSMLAVLYKVLDQIIGHREVFSRNVVVGP